MFIYIHIHTYINTYQGVQHPIISYIFELSYKILNFRIPSYKIQYDNLVILLRKDRS